MNGHILMQGGRAPGPDDTIHPPARQVSAPKGYREVGLGDPFEAFVGPMFERRVPDQGPGFDGKGELWAAFYIDDRHVNGNGVCHGGMLMTFADATLGTIASNAHGRKPCVTLSMQTSFMKAGRIGDLVEINPRLTQRTPSILFVEGIGYIDGEACFQSTSLWKVIGR